MPAYCGYARVPIVGMPGHRLRPLFHEIVGWNAMDLMREFLQKRRVEGLTNHGGYATITPTSIGRLATLNRKSHKTPVWRHGTASETTPRITTHRRPVLRPRMAQIPPPPSWPDGAGTAGFSPVARHFAEGLRTSDSGLRKSSVVRSPMSFVTP